MKGKKDPMSSAMQADNRTIAGRFTVTKASLPAGSPAAAAVIAGQQMSTASQHQQQLPPPGVTPFLPFGHTQPVIMKQVQQHSMSAKQQHHHQHPASQQQPMLGSVRQQYSQQPDMEYVQIDTSYQPHAQQLAGRAMPVAMGGMPMEMSAKKGVLSQLIDKVRSKDERKKSSASGVSSSSSGGTIPHPAQPSQVPPATAVMGRRALSMYDAQCQYGTLTPMDSTTSAVAALALANSSVRQGEVTSQRRESRPIYTRAKSFVKSKRLARLYYVVRK